MLTISTSSVKNILDNTNLSKSTILSEFNMAKAPIGTTASTGQTCPESGVWKSLDTPSTTAPIAKGNRMPPHNGNAVTWKLTQYA